MVIDVPVKLLKGKWMRAEEVRLVGVRWWAGKLGGSLQIAQNVRDEVEVGLFWRGTSSASVRLPSQTSW